MISAIVYSSNSISAALVNHLWQSTVVALLLWLIAVVLRNNRAGVRYWIWMAASMKFLLPFSLLLAAGATLRATVAPAMQRPDVTDVMSRITEPFPQMRSSTYFDTEILRHPSSVAPILLFSLWACGALTVAFCWWLKWRSIRAAAQLASPITLPAPVPVLSTSSRLEPGIFGIIRPVLLLPAGIADHLSREQMDAVVAHEICHIRRRDNLTYALHMVVEVLFWFHPLVWWIGNRLVEEREHACDEAVLQSGQDAHIYAEGILNVCRFYLRSPRTCSSGVTGSNLKWRIVRIMTARPSLGLSFASKLLLTLAAVVFAAGPLGLGLVRAMQVSSELLRANGVRPSFEVASIKPSKGDNTDVPTHMSPEDFSMSHASLKDLIRFAYNIRSDDRIVGGATWMSSVFFDVHAKAGEAELESLKGLNFEKHIEATRLMVQSMLAERFQLQSSIEMRNMPVYALVRGKGAPKVKEVAVSPFPPAGTPPPQGAHVPSIQKTGPTEISVNAMPMHLIADWLSSFDEIGNRPIVDETDMKGNYDFVLNGVSMSPSQDPAVISIFTALQDQVGLRLIPRKAAVEVLVINRVEQPSKD